MTWHDTFRRRTFLRTAATMAGVGIAASTATAATTVSDGESIQAAIDGAPSGSTIHVEKGTYEESVSLPPTKALTLIGDPGGSTPGSGQNAPVLDGELRTNTQAFFLDGPGSEPITIRGFTVKDYGTVPDDTWGNGLSVGDRSNLTVEDCRFQNIGGSGVRVDSDGSYRPANWTIRRNRFVSIDHSAVHLSSNDGAVIANNVVESGPYEVNDSPDRWWEDDTEDHNPKAGIEVHATGKHGNDATLSGIDIVGNYVTGTYDDTAIRVLSINKNPRGDYPDSETLATNIDIMDNTVEITDELDDDGEGDGFVEVEGEDDSQTEGSDHMEDERDENGIVIGANPEAGPPAYVDDVTVAGNKTSSAGAGVAVHVRDPAEVRKVTIRDNALTDGGIGITLNGHGPETVKGVTVNGNDVVGNAFGVNLFNADPGRSRGDRTSSHVDTIVRENRLVDNDRIGVLAHGDRPLTGVILHRNDIADNGLLGALCDVPGSLKASCNFWGHPTGPEDDDNRKGQGNAVVGDVRYEPWLPQSFTRVPEEACKLENHRNE